MSPDSNTLKRCTKCGAVKPATTEYFRKSKSGRDGIAARCKDCVSQEGHDYYAANRDRIAAQQHEYYVQHEEERKAYAHNNYMENREKRIQLIDQWRAANPDKVQAAKRKWTTNNRQKETEKVKRWRAENPEKRRAQNHRRRALEKAVGGSFAADDIEAIRKAQGNRCYICGKSLKRAYHIDHFIPIALGGTNNPGNLRLACPHCNQSKNAKHPHELGMLL